MRFKKIQEEVRLLNELKISGLEKHWGKLRNFWKKDDKNQILRLTSYITKDDGTDFKSGNELRQEIEKAAGRWIKNNNQSLTQMDTQIADFLASNANSSSDMAKYATGKARLNPAKA